ncbi:uncharacterized protein ELE39_000001 [Cryptosporidium sp. chipmunk genotype I]|uniref:uncharacterized protein n=1 Tax=Cryptosporidium sp. chipmunk genotype I TaxID=1280935 RepID=UPI00351A9B44|nr:hypothetical protein ELE39_000001 [Cryptosporidium sp. chipmunk genotype I]
MKHFSIIVLFLTILLDIRLTEGSTNLFIPIKKSRISVREKWKKYQKKKVEEEKEIHSDEIYNTGELLLVTIIGKSNINYPYLGNAGVQKKCKEIEKIVLYAFRTELFYVAKVQCKKNVVIHGKDGEFSLDFDDKEIFINTDIVVTRKTVKHPSNIKVTSYKVGEVPFHCPNANNLNIAVIDKSFDVKTNQNYIKNLGLVFIGIISQTSLQLEFPFVDVETASIKNYHFNQFSYVIYEGSQTFTSIPILAGNTCDIKVANTIRCKPGTPINFMYELENGNLVSNQVKVFTNNMFGKTIFQDQDLNKLLERVKKALTDDIDR